MKNTKVFLLGIGAQKSGTTWLEAQLSKEIFFSNDQIKEYHVFDKLSYRCPNKSIQMMKKRFNKNKRRRSKMCVIQKIEAMRLMPQIYFDHFDYIYCRNQNISHVGDITPAYALLPKNIFNFIKQGLEAKGFKVKVVFLMRDPVERAWSQLRMKNRLNHERKGAPKISPRAEFKQLKEFYKKNSCISRTRYQETCSTIEKVFPLEDIYYGFYESFFNQQEINRLTHFLEAPNIAPDLGQFIHTSPKPQTPIKGMDLLKREIRLFYDPTYRWVNDRFPESIPNEWTQA